MFQLIDVAPISQRFTDKTKTMSVSPISGAHVPLVLRLPNIRRFISVVTLVFDVFTEPHEQARAARKRYPFAEW